MKTIKQNKTGLAWINKDRTSQAVKCVIAFSTMVLLGGCQGLQTFQKQPLDLPSHSSKWLNQAPDTDLVMDFVKLIEAKSGKSTNFNPANGVSMREAQMIALVYNPDLRVARLKANVAAATAKHAGLWDDPTVSFDILRVTDSVPKPWIVGGSISLTIPLSGRLRVEKSQAKAAMHAELDRVAEEEWRVANDLEKTWLAWSALQSELDQTKNIVSTLDSIVKSSKQLAEQGEIPKTEANLFTIEQTSQKIEIDRLRGEVLATEQEIRGLMGLSPKAPVKLISTLNVRSWAPNNQRLAINNPSLNRLRSEYKVAEYDLLLEIRKQYPDLEIGPAVEREEGQSKIGFLGAIPIPSLNANRGGIAKAKANRQLAEAAFETEYERYVGKIAALKARKNALNSQNASMKKTLIPLVDQQLLDAKNLIDLGEGDSLVLLESFIRAHEAKLKVIAIQLKKSQVESDIRFLLGPTNHKSIITNK
jgi:cobalt-zinc-cadmium efflux system outer membrane protein